MSTALILTQLITESLPISSSTHVWVLQRLYGQPALPRAVELVLDPVSLIVVIASLIYWYWPVVRQLPITIFATSPRGRVVRRGLCLTSAMLAISTAVTATAYFIQQAYGITWHPAWGLGGMLMLWYAVWWVRARTAVSTIDWRQALLVGSMQAVSLMPGVSRLGSTYCAGRLLGWRPRRALTYSLLLQIVLIKGELFLIWCAGGMPAVTELFSPIMFFGAIGAFVALQFTWRLAQRRQLWAMGWYATALLLFMIVKNP